MTSSITIDIDAQNIATMTWNMPNKKVNVFNEDSVAAFEAATRRVLSDPQIIGCVISSAKDVFHVGADLEMALRLADLPSAELFTHVMAMNTLLRDIERSGKVFVAAIEGNAMGGGLEMALTCHARILAEDNRIQMCLPEAKLGLMPGLGGTQRMARMLPLMDAIKALSTGKTYRPAQALSAGLATKLVEPGATIAAAKTWIKENQGAKQPWDEKRPRFPAGQIHTAQNLPILAGAAGQIRKNTFGNYPAPAAILRTIYHGLQMPMDQALKVEARSFVQIVGTQTARNMVKTLFFGMNSANALERKPDGHDVRKFQKIGVIGAGLMGAGIVYQAAKRKIDVVVIDRDPKTARGALTYSEKLLKKLVLRGFMSQTDADAHLARITASADYADLAECDLVVEAVFEDNAVKEEVLKAVCAAVPESTVIASNTSTIPITDLATYVTSPERFIGLHFFSPVEKMPLLEIISGQATSTATLAAAFDFAKALSKTPIDVNDGRAFFTTRVVSSYVAEGMALLREGVAPALIENAGKLAGMPMGPLRLADMVNLDLAVKIADQTATDLGPEFSEPPGIQVAREMVAMGRLGEKSGAGFYDHQSHETSLWSGLATQFEQRTDQPSLDQVTDRLMLIQATETLRCADDGVLKNAIDADLGSILGWGFAPQSGGIASYIDGVGPKTVLDKLETLSGACGSRFNPPEYLRSLVAQNASLNGALGGQTLEEGGAP